MEVTALGVAHFLELHARIGGHGGAAVFQLVAFAEQFFIGWIDVLEEPWQEPAGILDDPVFPYDPCPVLEIETGYSSLGSVVGFAVLPLQVFGPLQDGGKDVLDGIRAARVRIVVVTLDQLQHVDHVPLPFPFLHARPGGPRDALYEGAEFIAVRHAWIGPELLMYLAEVGVSNPSTLREKPILAVIYASARFHPPQQHVLGVPDLSVGIDAAEELVGWTVNSLLFRDPAQEAVAGIKDAAVGFEVAEGDVLRGEDAAVGLHSQQVTIHGVGDFLRGEVRREDGRQKDKRGEQQQPTREYRRVCTTSSLHISKYIDRRHV